ncbi:MAG: sulfate ABC transporter permease subunit CysT [Thermoguttaceae bacterium]|nr:sulfate ABC transporter permease subunit CysT [Thermoguttaceae bacterium]
MKKSKRKSVIPGFGITFGITMTILSVVVLIPLCSLVVFSAQLSPAEFFHTVSTPRVLKSYWISIGCSFVASTVNAFMGLALAWILVRYEFPGKRFVDGIIELPFALPTAVAGIALTHMTTVNGWVGKIFFDLFNIRIAYTPLGIIVALVFIGIPFVVRSVQPVLEKIDVQYEEAAAILGASRRRTFRSVIFPELLPALISGFSLAFARCIGEYGSVVFISGNIPYKTEIAPLMIMSQLQEYDYASATSIALVMLAIAFVILSVNAFLQSMVSKRVSGLS